MKTPVLVGIVVTAHCVAIGGIVLMQGCETLGSKEMAGGRPVVMPPRDEVDSSGSVGPVFAPVVKPKFDQWPTETTKYTVRKGDSISRIAHRYGLKTGEIVALNGIRNKDVIQHGQTIMLPGKIDTAKVVKRSVRPVPARVRMTSSPRSDDGSYVVKRGDSLSVIASRYSIPLKDIREANGIQGDMIRIGQKIRIPGVHAAALAPRPVAATPPPVVSVVVPDEDVAEAKTDDGVASSAPISDKHVVEEGQTLRHISMRWMVREADMRKANNLGADAELKAGQILLVPSPE
jgi:LysM repeat protein